MDRGGVSELGKMVPSPWFNSYAKGALIDVAIVIFHLDHNFRSIPVLGAVMSHCNGYFLLVIDGV